MVHVPGQMSHHCAAQPQVMAGGKNTGDPCQDTCWAQHGWQLQGDSLKGQAKAGISAAWGCEVPEDLGYYLF